MWILRDPINGSGRATRLEPKPKTPSGESYKSSVEGENEDKDKDTANEVDGR